MKQRHEASFAEEVRAMLFLTLPTAGCGFLTLREDIEQTSHTGILGNAEVAEEFNAIFARAIAVKR